MLFFQATVHAQPIVIPGFMTIESSYLEAPEAGSDSTLAYFTIWNLHYEPIIILSSTTDISENVTFNGHGHEEVSTILIQPSERLVMGPDGFHIDLDEIDTSISAGEFHEITLLVRRGLKAEEEIEGQEKDANTGQRFRAAGIPNEHSFVVNVPVRN